MANDVSQLVLPTFEGLIVDKFEIGFRGKVELDRTFDADEELIGALKLGRLVKLTVTAYVVAKPFRLKQGVTNAEDRASAGAKLDIRSVELISSEDGHRA